MKSNPLTDKWWFNFTRQAGILPEAGPGKGYAGYAPALGPSKGAPKYQNYELKDMLYREKIQINEFENGNTRE